MVRFPWSIVVLIGVAALAVSACGEDGGDTAAPRDAAAPATADDDAAGELLREALAELNTGNTAQARAAYERARAAYRSVGDVLGEGHVALGLAQLEHFTGQSDAARGFYSEALGLFREADSAAWQAKALVAWGDLEKDTFNWEPAAGFYRRARAQWEQAPDPRDSDHVILRLAAVTSLPWEEAREVMVQADKIYANLGDLTGVADVKMLFGAMELARGNLTAAHAHYGDARWIYQDRGLLLLQADAGRSVAELDVSLGYNVRATVGLQLTEQVVREAGDEGRFARLGLLRGDIERLQGRLVLARSHYAETAMALAALSDPAEAVALLRQGQVDVFLGNSYGAREALDGALAMFAQGGDAGGEAAALYSASVLAVAASDAAAEPWLARSAQLFQSVGDELRAGRAHLELARLLAAAGRGAEAAARADLAVAAFSGANSPIGAVLVHLVRGDIARAEIDYGTAAAAYRTAAAAFAEIPSPLTAMNTLIGQPPTDSLIALGEAVNANFYEDIAGGVRARTAEDETAIAANLAEFPDYLIEGRRALAALEAELAAATAFAEARN